MHHPEGEKLAARANHGTGQARPVLAEAANYHAMFGDFIGADATAKALVDQYVTWARQTLKKNDRIVWFLRWVRVELAGRGKHADSDAELAKLNRRLGTAYGRADLVPVANLMRNLAHFLSLPAPQIRQVVWGTQSPRGLLDEFKALEEEWKNSTDQHNLLHYRAGQEPRLVMQFPDGYAWFDLEKPSCDQEARAMGHCGNSASSNQDDNILSLRRLVKQANGNTYWYPVLTFILDRHGQLGEMKGRGNDKPVARYHAYIVALLRHPRIKGIKGGGYLPEHNFRLSDLDDATRDELLHSKPALGSAADLYKKEGMTERVLARLQAELGERGLPGYEKFEPDQKRFVVKSWASFADFISDMYDDPVKSVLEVALGEADFQQDRGDAADEFRKVVLDLPEHWQRRLVTRAELAGRHGRTWEELCDLAAQRLIAHHDDWFELFETLYRRQDALQDEAWDRLTNYVETGWPYAASTVSDNLPHQHPAAIKEFVLGKQQVLLYVDERDLFGYAAADDEDGDDEYSVDLMDMRRDNYNGRADWETVNDDYLNERRREDGLVDENDKDAWLGTVEFDHVLAEHFLAALQGGLGSPTVRDPRQHELKLEGAALRRLLALAGR